VAEKLYDLGAEVYAISRTKSNLEDLAKNKDRNRFHIFTQDVSLWDETKSLIESLPAMDGLVNNAGVVRNNQFFNF